MDQLLAAIERRAIGRDAPLIVALDGRSGTGKSTLAARLAVMVNAVVITCDDFYSGSTDAAWLARTPQQRAACCIDWRRLRREVVEPLRAGQRARYHPFDFAKGSGLARHTITHDPRPIVILDGAYSGRPELADIVDIAALLELSDGVRRGRLIAREGPAFMAAWHPVWDAAEDHYFTNICPPSRYDFVLTVAA